jgi:hypothetical protein
MIVLFVCVVSFGFDEQTGNWIGSNVKLSLAKRVICVIRLDRSMKDIAAVQSSLRKIPGALGDMHPGHPRFRGGVSEAFNGGLVEVEISPDGAALDARVDVRDRDSLFRELDGAFEASGVEALAWYHPFHLSEREWGIYIPMTSIHYCADRWFDRRLSFSRRSALALQALLEHELMHFACEYAVAQFELFLRACCWFPARERLTKAHLEWFNDEEALANANCVRQLQLLERGLNFDRLRQALRQSPAGYRDYEAALADEGFEDHALEVLRHNVGIPAVDLGTGLFDPAFDMLVAFPDAAAAKAICPVFFIDDGGGFDVPPLSPRQVPCIPEIVESKRFQKMFSKLDQRRQTDWQNMKAKLAKEVPRYPNFKMLKGGLKGLWGVYLSDGFRAHIRPAANGVWEAVEIGSHGAMGHG